MAEIMVVLGCWCDNVFLQNKGFDVVEQGCGSTYRTYSQSVFRVCCL